MAQERLIVAIGRIERALSRLEQVDLSIGAASGNNIPEADAALMARHEQLKSETRVAILEIDALIGVGVR
jgi:hypothetical protein